MGIAALIFLLLCRLRRRLQETLLLLFRVELEIVKFFELLLPVNLELLQGVEGRQLLLLARLHLLAEVDDGHSELLADDLLHVQRDGLCAGRPVAEEVEVSFLIVEDFNLDLLEDVGQLDMGLLEPLEVFDLDRLHDARRAGSEVHQLVQVFVESCENAEARALVQPVQVDAAVFLAILHHGMPLPLNLGGHFDHDGASLEEEDLVDLVSPLDDEGAGLVAFGPELVDDLLDDVLVQLAEVRDVLDHLHPEAEVEIAVLGQLLLELVEDDWVLLACLLEHALVDRGQRAVVVRLHSSCPLQPSNESDLSEVLALLQRSNSVVLANEAFFRVTLLFFFRPLILSSAFLRLLSGVLGLLLVVFGPVLDGVLILIALVDGQLLNEDFDGASADEVELEAVLVLANYVISRHKQQHLQVVHDEPNFDGRALGEDVYFLDDPHVQVAQDLVLQGRRQ
mmetsp:Transcript_18741/g.28765  ORF Transcript_18741/g.28765 Transcript_18741/m.28765 type:complete len:452 (+) Transcript_18741:418-1773(+)